MSNYGYDYLPAGSTRKSRRCFWAFVFAGFSLLAFVNILVLKALYRPPYSLLDRYHPSRGPDEAHGPYHNDVNVFDIPTPDERAVVTTVFTESYVPAVLNLGHSLSTTQVSARRIILYIPERLSSRSICQLQAVGWELHPIERIAPPDSGRGLFHRFVDNYSKLHLWALDQIGIKSVVFLDADTLVRSNFDELWSLPFEFAAVPDVYGDKRGFTLSFNAGVMFLRTSTAVFNDLLTKIDSEDYHHGEAEQGLLNWYFAARVVLLPYIYNANLMIKQRSPELWHAIEDEIRVVHYTMLKPFIEEERHQAMGGIWKPEMEWWETAWLDAFSKDLLGKC
ncbi:nucleotide-diphospho-sugar transferase [Fomitiporia mediterranea MF3/22]|uniref:nucleotide-diphospho-sugar transferase n=1 Tax=Fomitiporia mediterranea (strain MF3/22) TaxID=694068 RepID=UPI0004409C02|nr:nucleotide-diphospho-sugar transferase [Fomitiporia mediterranea MF3/22]EJD00887.1 nucleotide-diphospho-sugar transferase [Fomitiporia mediterranea MF3/22]